MNNSRADLPALARVRRMVLFSSRHRLYAGEIATQLHLGIDVVWECLKKLERDGEIRLFEPKASWFGASDSSLLSQGDSVRLDHRSGSL